MAATALYRSLLLACERRRLQLGWPMAYVDDMAGLNDAYYAKMLYSETPSGRKARYETLQWVLDALWPDGVGMVLRGAPVPDDSTMRRRIEAIAKRYRKRNRAQHRIRSHLREYASAKDVRP